MKRSSLRAAPSPRSRGCDLRVLLRPTQTYVFVKRQLARKDACLSDGLAQEEVLHVLWRSARGRPDLEAITLAERDDLWVGDVPRIGARPGSADLLHHARGRLAGALGDHGCPGPEVVLRLSRDDLERQLSFLRTAVRASPARPGRSPEASSRGRRPALDAGPEALVETALAVARQLDVRALRDGEQASWLCLVRRCPPRGGSVLAATWLDLADGQAGIAWHLRDLAATTGAAGVCELAAAATARLLAQIVEAGSVDADYRGGLLLALSGAAHGRGDDHISRLLDGDGDGDGDGLALAARVLGLAALERGGAGDRRRLARAAARLASGAAAGGAPATLVARALAEAAEALDAPALGTAALGALEAACSEGGPALEVLARASIARTPAGAGARPRRGMRAAVAAVELEPGPSVPTLDRLLDALALEAAAGVLDDALLRRQARRLVAGALATIDAGGRPLFDRGLETPGLRDGLAGVGAALLALARGERTTSESALLLSRALLGRTERIGASDPGALEATAA